MHPKYHKELLEVAFILIEKKEIFPYKTVWIIPES